MCVYVCTRVCVCVNTRACTRTCVCMCMRLRVCVREREYRLSSAFAAGKQEPELREMNSPRTGRTSSSTSFDVRELQSPVACF